MTVAQGAVPAVRAGAKADRSLPAWLPVVVSVGCAAAGLAILAAMTAVGRPGLAPAAAAVVLALPVLLTRPTVLLVLVAVVEAGNLSGVGQANGVPSTETALLGLAVLAAAATWWRGRARPAFTPLIGAVIVYLAVQALALFVAHDPVAARASVADTAKALVWPLVLGILLLAPGRAPQRLAQGFAVTLALLGGLSVVQEFVLHNSTTIWHLSNLLVADPGDVTARHAGPEADANFWGRVLVMGLPFALSLAQLTRSRVRKGLWLLAAVSVIAGAVLTGSRGTLLAVFVVLVAWPLLAGGRAAKGLLLTPLVIGALLLVPGVGSRLATLSTIDAGQGLTVADPSLEGRVDAQQVALHMAADHPLLGVGPGNFLAVEPEYQRRLALDSPLLAPHNQYLEAAAQTGLIGLAAWLLLFGTVVFSAWRARVLARACRGALDDEAPVPLANAVLAAMAGWAVASAFLHLATFRTFLLVAVLAAALDVRARRRLGRLRAEGWLPPAEPERSRWQPFGTPRRIAAAGVLSLAVGGAAIGGAVWGSGQPTRTTWTVTASMQLALKFNPDLAEPGYDLNTLTRRGLVRTFGGLAMSPRFVEAGERGLLTWGDSQDGTSVDVVASSTSGLISYRAHAPSAVVATTLALETRAAASRYIGSLTPIYGVEDVPAVSPATRVDVVPVGRALELPLAALGGVGVLTGLALFFLAARRRTSGGDSQERAGTGAPPQPATVL